MSSSAPLPAQAAPAASRLPAELPPLREDLQLHAGAPHADGSPGWLIQDPVSNAFYRVGWLEFELLSRWDLRDPQRILRDVAAHTLLQPTEEELTDLFDFLAGHQLLDVHDPRYTRYLIERHRKGRPGRLHWLLHHYLFFRVPLLRPADLLRRALPWLAWIYTPATACAVAALGVLGLLLTARQWDSFSSSFLETFSFGGLWGYLVALAVTKSLHELGHAMTATRYGLRVAHMGVAFIVMWPMLYTDTGESWRLRDRRQRLAIASAGIVTELAVAALATLAWNLAADGSALKQSLFFLASTAWVLSLALNVSPFMRFDGYFILSDLLDMPNLHERAGALARAALRRTLLGWQEPDPESLAAPRRHGLVAFALLTWVYRLVVFAGIAVAVYLFFFKALGVLLFIVEVWWFIARPVWKELQLWWSRRADIQSGRWRVALLIAVLCLLPALLPWSGRIDAPAWAHPEQVHVFYSPLPARLKVTASPSGAVAAGDTVFELDQPELDYRADVSRLAGDTVSSQLHGLGGLSDGEEKRAVLERQLDMRRAELRAQRDEAARLLLKAPFDGVLTDVDTQLAAGVWVSPQQPLAVLLSTRSWQAEAFVSQREVARLAAGAAVRFHPEGRAGLAPLTGRVLGIESTRTARLPHALLSATHGGAIPVLQDASGMTPRDALYRVRIALDQPPPLQQVLRGSASIESEARSWLLDAMKPVLIVLVRELGF